MQSCAALFHFLAEIFRWKRVVLLGAGEDACPFSSIGFPSDAVDRQPPLVAAGTLSTSPFTATEVNACRVNSLQLQGDANCGVISS